MLIVEDGTGLDEADSYVSLDDASEYWGNRNNAIWLAADDPSREAALRVAADYIGYVYRFPGQPTLTTQRLAWPRAGVPSGSGLFVTNAVPGQISDAQLLLAIEALQRNILAKPAESSTLVEETKSLRGLTKTQKFQVGGIDTNTGLQRFPMVDELLRGVAVGGTGGSFASIPLTRV